MFRITYQGWPLYFKIGTCEMITVFQTQYDTIGLYVSDNVDN